MLTNVITDAFNGVTSIPVACDLLEAFASLAKRPAVQRAVEKRAAEVHVEFLTQVSPSGGHRRWGPSGGHITQAGVFTCDCVTFPRAPAAV